MIKKKPLLRLMLALGLLIPTFYACNNDDDNPIGSQTLTIGSITPREGPVNTVIEIKGGNYIAPVTVKFGNKEVKPSDIASEVIMVTVPSDLPLGEISVTVTANGLTSNAVTFTVTEPTGPAPQIGSLAPSRGAVGASVTINGANFGDAPVVKFGNVEASATAVSDNAITVTVPTTVPVGEVPVTVVAGGRASSPVTFVITEVIQGFTVVNAIEAQDDLPSLEAALKAANLIETLQSDTFTVFAPNNAAFDALVKAQGVTDLDALVAKLGTETLSAILQAHVISGSLKAENLRDRSVLTTLSGSTITITNDGQDNITVNGAKVLEADLLADNGVVHVIDSVINLSAANTAANGFTVTIENLSTPSDFYQSGVFDTPVNTEKQGAASPGESYAFSFYAPRSLDGVVPKLSFVTMFTNSNDLFLAPSQDGLALYDANGVAITGDITGEIALWDLGTEVNEEPGGPNQPAQARNAGTAEEGNIVRVPLTADGTALDVANITTNYPLVSQLVSVSISNEGPKFTVTINNLSGSTAVPGGVSPGVYAVHSGPTPFFSENGRGGSLGLKAVAEDGDIEQLEEQARFRTGFVVPLSPVVYALHARDVTPLFTTGEADRGQGLEALAEDGSPATLAANLPNVIGVESVGVEGTAPLAPGQPWSFTLNADAGDHLSLVSMYVQSNDLFFTFPENGIALFNENGRPVNGDVSPRLLLYDAGTEVNQYPGAGPDQAPRQSGANVGKADPNNTVRRVPTDEMTPYDGYVYRPVRELVRIRIEPNP